jgi:hypothetical protein
LNARCALRARGVSCHAHVRINNICHALRAGSLVTFCVRRRHEGRDSPCFGRKGWFAFLTNTQLCPFIWAVIIGLVAMFVYKARPFRMASFSSLCNM